MSSIAGRQPVLEALRSGREINRLLIAKGQRKGSIRQILTLAEKRGVLIQEVDRRVLDRLSEIDNHQGVLAQLAQVEYLSLDELLARDKTEGWAPLLVLLDGIQDPHNLGSIIRSAEAAGAHGVIIPERRAAGVTAAAMKASAGAANYLPVCRVVNLVDAMETLKKAGYWIAGADMEGEACFQQDLTGPLALVVGGEGKGLSRLVREKCDFLTSIPMRGRIGSLNASVAAAVLLFEVLRQRS
ncbi:MAG TPA: 23S rRNA (guanosine(2251)-2'-O)-methyltransferase RlmB [Firmicutes bacterium]|nr:23S rRNA (guanosine(2251)-2'-O)-methyltransferase RlmB [Bacillota bacterium]